MITLIPIEKLHPHPDNPRKALGELTELAESIKANGIYQNLTVVPDGDGTYTIIIGHRRKAAAELAGLTELPCAIVEMSEKEQKETMIIENMQRSDLTVYEQAQALQMMIDLGESVESISKSTGISKTKIYHRVHLLDLDPEEFKKSQEKNITINDYIRLEQLKSPERKNKALQSIGTDDYYINLQKLIDEEKQEAEYAKTLEYLNSVATEITSEDKINSYYSYKNWSYKDKLKNIKTCIKEIQKENPNKDIFFEDNGSFVYFYLRKENKTTPTETPEELERKQSILEVSNKIQQFNETVQNTFKTFLKNYIGRKEHQELLLKIIIPTFVVGVKTYDNGSIYRQARTVADLLNLETETEQYNEVLTDTDFEKLYSKDSGKLMLICLYSQFAKSEKYYKADNLFYKKNKKLDKWYEILEAVGYKMSDEEKAFQNGTHSLFEENKKLRGVK